MRFLMSVAAAGLLALMAAPGLAKDGNNGNHYGWYKGLRDEPFGPRPRDGNWAAGASSLWAVCLVSA